MYWLLIVSRIGYQNYRNSTAVLISSNKYRKGFPEVQRCAYLHSLNTMAQSFSKLDIFSKIWKKSRNFNFVIKQTPELEQMVYLAWVFLILMSFYEKMSHIIEEYSTFSEKFLENLNPTKTFDFIQLLLTVEADLL